jgi:aspartyl-tRNA(Asn)/glutamyl-tRNA(Gln) amidotransferase subunit C
MTLTTDNVRKIATLARLRLTPEEESLFAGQLGAIVDYIDQLEQYAPGGEAAVVPTGDTDRRESHEIQTATPEAADEIWPCLPREQFLANAPASLDGFLLVPEIKGTDDGE